MTALADLLQQHRSIRSFKPDPIADDVIHEVIDQAIAGGSSSGNLNSYSLVLTRDPERKQVLYDLHLQQPMVLEAPLVITFCADWYRTRAWLKRRGARDGFNDFLGYHVAAFDAIIVAQNVCLGFEARGYGICYMGTTLYAMEQISRFLGLPETCVPVTSIVVGVPNEQPAKRDRLPTHAFIHDETYRLPDDAELEAVYAQREVRGWARYMSMPQVKAQLEAHGITSLAEYYTSKIKYDPDIFAQESARMVALLEAKGFMRSGPD